MITFVAPVLRSFEDFVTSDLCLQFIKWVRSGPFCSWRNILSYLLVYLNCIKIERRCSLYSSSTTLFMCLCDTDFVFRFI